MPYSSIDDLPDPIQVNLPKHAQEIFMKAFNSAYERLKSDESEVRAFKVGWAAVKKRYEKRDGRWRRKRAA